MSSSVLGADLNAAYQRDRGGPAGWWILDGPELHLGPDVLVPDLAGWRRERLPAVNESLHASVAPDWICEVLSPSTYRLDRVKKLRVYAREKIAYAWLVNPTERTLEILRLERGQWVIAATHLDLWGEIRTPKNRPSPRKKNSATKAHRTRGLTRR